MKKLYVVLLSCVWGIGCLQAQNGRPRVPLDWHLRSLSDDGVYGAGVYKAYEYLKGQTAKRKVVVAIIDGGLDITHEDLKGSLWVNVNEIPGNEVDDDGNGYVDDVHGWNFLGTPDGKTVKNISTEADRYHVYLKDKFAGADTNRLSKKDLELYHYYRNVLPEFSGLAFAENKYDEIKAYAACAEEFDRELKTKYPGVELTKEHFETLEDEYDANSLQGKAHAYFKDRWQYSKDYNWEKMFHLRNVLLKTFEGRYRTALRGFESDGRAEVGDDLNNIKNRFYGNATMRAHEHGSHVAGIVGATRNNGIGIDGVADVELMNLIACTGTGDEYDKDLACAIRYAVENGANIINISLGRAMSMHKKWVDDAIRFAEKKGVLIVHAAGNEGRCTNHIGNYPSRFVNDKKAFSNFINVGNAYADGLPVRSSNFGDKEVDLFAQGGNIHSTVTGNEYKQFSGTSMASPVVAGVAALIWNYFPELSVKELRQVLLEGVTSRKGVEVDRPAGIKELGKDKVYFEDLCVSAGILNALNSVKLAEKMCKTKK